MANKFFLFFLLLLGVHTSKAQSIYGYDKNSNRDNIGIFAGLSLNSTGPLIHEQFGGSTTAKGASSILPSIGIHYQKAIGSRLNVRIGFSFGHTSNAYKYSTNYDSLTPEYYLALTKNATYTIVKHGTSFVLPQVELGYVFGPIKDMYLIELRAGVGVQAYLGKSGDSTTVTSGAFYDRTKNYTANYTIIESATYGKPNTFGSFVTNIYAGMKWQKTTNPFLNNFAIGIQATLPISNNDAGYSNIEYKGADHQAYAKQQVYFSQFSFGIKASYNLL